MVSEPPKTNVYVHSHLRNRVYPNSTSCFNPTSYFLYLFCNPNSTSKCASSCLYRLLMCNSYIKKHVLLYNMNRGLSWPPRKVIGSCPNGPKIKLYRSSKIWYAWPPFQECNKSAPLFKTTSNVSQMTEHPCKFFII
jgi:hypothetical protein